MGFYGGLKREEIEKKKNRKNQRIKLHKPEKNKEGREGVVTTNKNTYLL